MGLAKDSKGCFCYRVLQPCELRSSPDTDDDARVPESSYIFKEGDFVSIDLIQDLEGGGDNCVNGPYLRLSDGAG